MQSPDARLFQAFTQARGVLALELSPGSTIAHEALQQADAGRLAGLVGRDVGTLVPEASELDLVFAAAHFDPAEVLRPGWPLHRRLDELHQRAPKAGHGPRVIAFGADRDGQIPQPLRAEDELRGGSLRVLPFLFAGEAAVAGAAAERMETLLMDRGMAQADTALCAQEAFGARIEHARYLTVHDLAAMTALQYHNLGLDALWRVVEAALLTPDREAVLDAAPEPLLRYADGEARIALFSPDAWRRRYMPESEDDATRLERRFELFQARQRQFAAVLQAHGIDVTFAHCDEAGEL
ncbi:hypothetical protein [Lysobacter sp. M2-1]|uniref:hypothetical protein n=1 Tax=Lysobacter sp. M2-1 TaxID=2916839 RepID=UPI001F592C28|nr:hypothetical protein [Lysobacter sp. M2-1]